MSPLCSLSATVPLCIMLHNRWQQPCSGWGHCLGCQKHLTCQLGRRMNSRTNCCQGQILPECVCVNTGILVHLARGVNADEVWFGYCICTVVNITGERKKSFCATANLSSSRCTWRYVSAEPAADWREVEVRGVLFRAIDTLWIEWASCPCFVAKVLNASGNQIHLHIL